MRARGPRFGWLVVDAMQPTGTHTDEDGRPYVDYTVSFRVRRWHPGYWLALARAWWRSR